MHSLLQRAFAVLLLFSVAMPGMAGDEKTEKVWQGLALLLPELEPDAITPSPVPGLYEVVLGPKVFYVTEDTRFLIQGDVIDLESRVNVTQPRVNQVKADAIEKVGEQNMLIFSPEVFTHTVTVFTDIDCGFCRKMHREMESYFEQGIRIRYLFFPRAGELSASYRKAVSVWCADDPKAMMTLAKTGAEIEENPCVSPVPGHMALGEMMGVTGTPALVLPDGRMIPGYVPADKLVLLLSEPAGRRQ
jgi:thiol:disulfide interchange protein DsbC